MLNILYGPPGSGKTTAIQGLMSNKDITYISVGEIYRKEVEKRTKFSKVLKDYVEADIEYPQEVIRAIVEPYLASAHHDEIIVLDGFPKHVQELEIFKQMIEDRDLLVPGKILVLELDINEARKRILNRRVCSNCDYHTDQDGPCPRCGNEKMIRRHDDGLSEFTARFNKYLQNNKVIVGKLVEMGFEPVTIDATLDKERIREEIHSTLFEVNSLEDGIDATRFKELTGLDFEVMSTVDHPYVSPPVRLLDSHRVLFEINKLRKVCILNWDVSQPNERTYRYDMQIDLGLVGRNKALFLFEEGRPYALQGRKRVELSTYKRIFDATLDGLAMAGKLSDETIRAFRSNYQVLEREVLSKIVDRGLSRLVPHYTKQALIEMNKLLGRDELGDFIDGHYMYYFNSSMMLEWIPYCIENIGGHKSIDRLVISGVFGRKVFRSLSEGHDEALLNDPLYIAGHKKHIADSIRQSEVIPSIELLYWSLEIANKYHFGNDYGFFGRYEEYLGRPLSNQLTSSGQDGENYFEMGRDYGATYNEATGTVSEKSTQSGMKLTRVNSMYGFFILLGESMREINNTEPHKRVVEITDGVVI